MKIAVCLSGQPRVFEYALPSILDFFSGDHEFDFFCHTWNYNTYKRLKPDKVVAPGEHPIIWTGDEPVDEQYLRDLFAKLNPKKFEINGPEVLPNANRTAWDSLFYSLMYANFLKKAYEIEHNFRYDFVIRTRYDIVYYPNTQFVLTPNANKDNYLDIFHLHCGRMAFEYDRVNASDVFFYGSSLAMDAMSDVYRRIVIKSKERRLDDYECLGPGTGITDYGDERNIKSISTLGEICETVYRPEIIPADPRVDFGKIQAYNASFYKTKTDD
jgi:hypothetical protein